MKISNLKSRLLPFVLVLIITVPAFISLLNNSYFLMHDDQHIARLFLLDQAIRQGDLYPRWVDVLGFGYGYPLFNFYPPLIYYIGEFFRLLGFSYIWSIKLVIITGFISSAWGIYLLTKRYIGNIYAYLTTALYTFFTYHAILVYVRGALAEFFSLSILPFIFLSLDNLAQKINLRNSIFFGLTFCLLILTHPLIAFPSLIFIGLFLIHLFTLKVEKKKKLEFIKYLGLGFILGLTLSAFFWLPSMAERKFTLVDNILTKELASYKIHYVYLQQFWYSPWNYLGSAEGLADGMSFQLGKIHIFLAVLAFLGSVIYLIKNKWKMKLNSKDFYFFVMMLLLSLFMTTDYSGFIWDQIKYLWYLQFPWRFLTFSNLFIALTGGYSLYFLGKLFKQKYLTLGFVILFILLTIGVYQKYFFARPYQTTDKKLTSYNEIAWRVSRTSHEFIPKGVETTKSELDTTIAAVTKESIRKTPYEIPFGEAVVKSTENKYSKKEFDIDAKSQTRFRLNTFNFPGWKAYLDGERIMIDDNNKLKLITVSVPQGTHQLLFKFENTPIRTTANLISIVGLLTAVFLFSKRKLVKK